MKVVWLAPYPINKIPSLKVKKNNKQDRGTWLVNLLFELQKRSDIEIHLITYTANIPYSQTIQFHNCTFYIIKHTVPIINKGYPSYFRLDILLNYKKVSSEIIKIINKINPDLIHAHGTENAYSMIVSKLKQYPNVTSIQGLICELIKIESNPYYRFQKRIELYSIKNNKNFGCRTSWDKNFIQEVNKNAKIYYLPEAINNIYFSSKWKFIEDPVIIFIGTIIKRKGIEDLINILPFLKNDFPKINLKIIGSGNKDYISYLQSHSKELGVDSNIIWLGFLSPEQISNEMLNSKVYVLPSYSDNSPNSLCEAMAIGIPSIAYKTGGIPSLIDNYINGILVETGNIENLKIEIKKVLSEKSLSIQLSNGANEKAKSRNFPPAVAESTFKVYTEIIKNFKIINY